jgi:hypothetical protein
VDGKAYDTLLDALATRNPEDFEKVPLGGTRKLLNPLVSPRLMGTQSLQ